MKTACTVKTIRIAERVHGLLYKINQLNLPPRSRRDVECILVQQVTHELDRALPSHRGHGRRTARIAKAIGRAAGVREEELHHLKLAALLHDIGLLMIPRYFVERADSLEPDAFIEIQHHSRLGAMLLEPYGFLKEASVLIAHHHERWDGTGYPYGIRGTFIPLGARILSIADAFDAITVPGADSPEVRDHVAYRIIRVASGTQFDPSIVATLEEILKLRVTAISLERLQE